MSKIALSEGFSVIPEGTHIFQITEVIYKEEFGKMEIKMKTAKGQTHTERFNLMGKDGSMNQGAINAFSYFAKTALNDFTLSEIDHTELVGHYIRAEVIHTQAPSDKDPSKMMTFANLGDESPADGFDEAEVPAAAPAKATPAKAASKPVSGKLDLDALLGNG